MITRGRRFFKMSGSGNDFVFIDARVDGPGELAEPRMVQRVCARGTGIGADGVVFLLQPEAGDVRMRYLNADGSLAAMCGNATLCTTRLASELGIMNDPELLIDTDSGVVSARIRDGLPEIDLPVVTEIHSAFDTPLESGERRIGFAMVGVPHLVILCDDVESAPVAERGRTLRHHRQLPHGANVNFVSPREGGFWAIRTYERGVEAETLACGTGAVATAVLLATWGLSRDHAQLLTRSGNSLRVRLDPHPPSGFQPSLAGEGRVVFVGEIAELAGLGTQSA